jgi:hypothetical protein
MAQLLEAALSRAEDAAGRDAITKFARTLEPQPWPQTPSPKPQAPNPKPQGQTPSPTPTPSPALILAPSPTLTLAPTPTLIVTLTLTRFADKLGASEELRALWQRRGEALLEAALSTERKLLVMVRRRPR